MRPSRVGRPRRWLRSFALACLAAGSASAQTPTPNGAEFQVNSHTTSNQSYPSVAAVGTAGDFVVVWDSVGQDGDSYGFSVFGQRFDSGGNRRGAEFQVNSYTMSQQRFASVAAMGTAGDFVVAWHSYGQDGSSYGVFGQRFDSGGNKQGAEFQVNSYTTSNQQDASMATAGTAGDFLVAWHSSGQDGSAMGVFGQRFDSGGNKQGAEFQVNSYTTSSQFSPAVAAVGTAGDFLVAWQGSGQDGNGTGVFGQRFDSGGNKLGTEFQVNSYTANDQRSPSVAAVGTAGNFVVAWRSSSQDGNFYGVFGQRFDSGGNKLGAEFQVNSYTTSAQTYPSVASVGTAGDFVVAWHSVQDGHGWGVFGQRFDSGGSKQGAEFQVNSYTSGNQQFPSAARGTNGDFVVAWYSYAQDGNSGGVFGQRFSTPLVTITAPGSTQENWAVGSVQRVRAEHDLGDGATFDIIVSHDGGGTFPTTAGSGVVGGSTAVNQSWTVTDNGGSPALPQSAKVQVVSLTPSSGVLDTSRTFQIQSPSLIVDRPRNNVRVSGGTFKIVWSHNLGYRRPFKIELSRNGTSYTETITASTLSQWAWRGEANWTPTGAGTCAPSCKVKITLLDTLGKVGESSAFLILP